MPDILLFLPFSAPFFPSFVESFQRKSNILPWYWQWPYRTLVFCTFRALLLHYNLTKNIQRLEAKLNQIIDRLDVIVYKTRCFRDDNHTAIQRTIDQNNRMLNQLERTAYNTHEASRYAQLAANYSKANAYFALAEYLK